MIPPSPNKLCSVVYFAPHVQPRERNHSPTTFPPCLLPKQVQVREMRSRSSSKHTTRCIEMDRPKLKEEPQLSGAYIRSLVKQLSSSRAKEPSSPASDQAKFSDAEEHSPPPPPPPQPEQPKKQVRRRLHTSRPYQERLLNMAEARREIVTALKYHRAAMKQATEQNHSHPPQQILSPPPPPPLSQPSPPPPPLEDPHIMDSIIHPIIYQSNYTTQNHTPYSSYCWSYPLIAPLPNISDTLNLPLPNQPLGLNLNFQGFNNIEIPLNKPPIPDPLPYQSPSSPSTSYSYSSPPASTSSLSVFHPPGGTSLHPAMDDEEMREIRSISEQHDIEWNDTVNLVTSAWWSKFLKTMEVGPGDGVHAALDEAMVDMPAWLAGDDGPGGDPANLSCLLPQYFDDCGGYLQDDALPCLDIGEIEGLDGDWLL